MNIRQDILTPKERVMSLLTGKPLDRMICMPIMTSNTVLLTGKTAKEYQLDGKVMAEAHMAAYKRFGYDLIYLFTNCSFIAEAM
jgi:uroporphyrinogen decarboxylase